MTIVDLFKRIWRNRCEARSISSDVLAAVKSHQWSGDFSEMERVIEGALDNMNARGATLQTCDLPFVSKGGLDSISVKLPIDLPGLLKRTEEAYIKAAMEKSGGNKKVAASYLKIPRTTLLERIRRNRSTHTYRGYKGSVTQVLE